MRSRHSRPNWSPTTTIFKGVIKGPVMDFKSIPPKVGSPLRNCALSEARARQVEFDLDEVHLSISWSAFDGCTFRQRLKRSYDGTWPQGSFAIEPTIYRKCTFIGIRFQTLGGFSAGQARFEDCEFKGCRFDGLFSHCADWVRCTFHGAMSGCVFYGSAPSGQPCAGKVNEILGNDFTDVRFTNVGWRRGIDVDAQRWPTGYVPDTDF